jgi:hypothetical protein
MARAKKYDGVIEAVHYRQDGQIDWVRAFERRGFVFTDWLKLDRQTLLERLQDGGRFYVGRRIPLMGNEFEISEAVRLAKNNGDEIIVAGDLKTDQDHLEGVPII